MLAARVDWAVLERDLRRRRLLALLGERIIEVADGSAPAHFVAATEAAAVAGRAQNAYLELASLQIAGLLARAGIPSVFLKGPHLGSVIYGRPGLRLSSDIDLLVAREHLAAAARAVELLGYRILPTQADRGDLPLLHLVVGGDGLPPLELHWRIHHYESRFSADLLARSREEPGFGRRPTRIDELASLLLFYARDGFVDLRLACDLAAWWDRYGAELSDGALADVLLRYPALERALLAAALAAHRAVALPLKQLLRGDHAIERRIRFAVSLSNPDAAGSEIQQVAETHLIDWLLAPASGHRAALDRQLHYYRRADSDRPNPAVPEPVDVVLHAVRLARRYALALVRSVRTRIDRRTSTARD